MQLSVTKAQSAIIEWTCAMRYMTGNLPPMPGVFPDYLVPIGRRQWKLTRQTGVLEEGCCRLKDFRRTAADLSHQYENRRVTLWLQMCAPRSGTFDLPRVRAGNRCPLNQLTNCKTELRRISTDWDRIEGNWKQTKGKIKEKWGKLTDDDLTQIKGKREQLEGRIQQRYGLAKDRAQRDVDDWLKQQS